MALPTRGRNLVCYRLWPCVFFYQLLDQIARRLRPSPTPFAGKGTSRFWTTRASERAKITIAASVMKWQDSSETSEPRKARSWRGRNGSKILRLNWGGWLGVRWLWVAGSWRGRGQGTRLLAAAEAMALEHGATAATLETHNSDALAFYKRRGFSVFGTLEDFPPGHAKYFLRKALAGPKTADHKV